MSELPKAIFLMGPTGVGKTDLAVQLVETGRFEIISVDSAMIYRGMNIGTAKPEAEILACAPHRLVDICDVTEAYSAARFRDEALQHMDEITTNGRIPLLVGGTGLYFRSLQQGISLLPPADPVVRARLDADANVIGYSGLHKRLSAVDPAAGERIHPNDPQRIQRALEVFELTGVAMSDLQARDRGEHLPYRVLKLALNTERRELIHQRVATRFHQMLEQGLEAEVEGFFKRGDLAASTPGMRVVGYREVWAYLEGKMDRQAMTDRAIIATRQLAKRQMTWLRSEKNLIVMDCEGANLHKLALDFISQDAMFHV